VTAVSIGLSLLGVLLTLVGAVYLVRDTRRLRTTGTKDPGLGGQRGLALAACLVGMTMTSGASLLVR